MRVVGAGTFGSWRRLHVRDYERGCRKLRPNVISRTPDLDVHEVPDGYVVYHGKNDSVSYLNKTAAIVNLFISSLLVRTCGIPWQYGT